MLVGKAIWGSAERRGVPPRWRQAENAVVVEFCRLHQCRRWWTFWERRAEGETEEPRELQREREREQQRKSQQREPERETHLEIDTNEREREKTRAMRAKLLELVRRSLQYKVSATAAVAPSHVENDLQKKPSPTGAVIGAHLPPPAPLTRAAHPRVWPNRLHWRYFAGDIFNWRYYCLAIFCLAILCWAIFCWRYFAGDISSVNRNNLVLVNKYYVQNAYFWFRNWLLELLLSQSLHCLVIFLLVLCHKHLYWTTRLYTNVMKESKILIISPIR